MNVIATYCLGADDVAKAADALAGEQHPGKIPENLKRLDEDALILAGGGIFGHNDRAMAGAKAMRQALDATLSEIPREEYAELKAAREQWGLP